MKYIREALKLNGIRPSLYVEPFAGGASVALQLLNDNAVDHVLLMDKDPWIASFWQTVFWDSDWLIQQIMTISVTVEKWREFKGSEPITVREQALTCFFLNRTSFSGILQRSAGPIGGSKQESKYLIDCRFMREGLVQRVKNAAKHRDRVTVWETSWDDGLKRMEQDKSICDALGLLFMYLDPPFFEEAHKLYRYCFKHEDHIALRDYVLSLSNKYMLSYDSVEHVQTLYGPALMNRTNGTQKHQVDLVYSVNTTARRKRIAEVVITNLENLPTQALS